MHLRYALLLALLLAPALSAQDDAAHVRDRLAPVFLDESLNTGDYDAWLAKLIEVIEENPGDAFARVALKRAVDIEPELADTAPLYAMLRRLADDDFKPCGLWAHEFADAYVKIARNHDTRLLWKPVAEKWRGIDEASFIGPFADGDASCHDDAFPPEVLLDFAAEYDGAYGPVRWAPARHHDPLRAELDLYRQQRWTGHGYYVATDLISDRAREAVLFIEITRPCKVWVNGGFRADFDARRFELPGVRAVELNLVKGVNTVLVKVSSISSLRLRATGPDGQLLKGVVARHPPADSAPIPVTTPPWTREKPKGAHAVNPFQPADHLRDPGANPLECALLHLAAGEIHDRLGMRIAGGESREAALELAGDNPLVVLEYLRALDGSPLRSGSDKRRLVRDLGGGTGDAPPVPVLFLRAETHTEDERYRDAIHNLERALDRAAQKWRVYLAMDKVFRDSRWRMERERVIRLALDDAPAALPVLRAARRYYAENGALANEVEIERRILKALPGDRDAHMSLMHTLTRMGELDDALKHARVLLAGDPADEFLLGRLAELLAAGGGVSEALKVYETLSERSPRPERELFQAARVCLQLGRDEEGMRYLQRVLEISPGHHLARRQLQLMRGESEDFWRDHAVTWEEAMEHDVSAEDFPRADSALVLDEMVQVIYADGSSVSYVHQVRKILTQEGVDVRGRERISGELVTARTVKPDGTVLEPIAQPGGMVEFPGVEVGAYLDIAYLVRGDGGPHRTLDGDAFFFVDQNLAEPFAISRWVILAPENANFNVVYHNLGPDDEGVTIAQERAAGRVIYTWDVRNPRQPESETFMPSPLEFIPWIEFVKARNWKDRARSLADDGLGRIMDTALIRRRARTLLDGHGDADDIARARIIYDWVNANFTTEGDAWNAHQALGAGAGDRQELFVSLCAAAGLRMGFAGVDSPPPYKQSPRESLPRPHWAYPHRDDFELEMIVIENENGERAWIDMADRLRPFGEIPARRFAAPAVLWLGGAYSLAHLPGGDREKDRFENRVHIKLAADGGADLEGSITVRGERSFSMKEAWRTTSYDRLCRELESNLAQHYKGFEVNECRFPDIGDVGEPLVQEYDGTVRRMGKVDGQTLSLELPGEKLGRLLSVLVGKPTREHDLVIDFDLVQTDEIRISPPEGYAFAGVPRDLVYPTAPLVYALQFRMDGGDLLATRKLALGPGRFTPAEYPNLVEQVKKIRQSENSVLKLRKLD